MENNICRINKWVNLKVKLESLKVILIIEILSSNHYWLFEIVWGQLWMVGAADLEV